MDFLFVNHPEAQRPQSVTVRLWDGNDELILEEDILVHCVAGQAHAEQGELILPE